MFRTLTQRMRSTLNASSARSRTIATPPARLARSIAKSETNISKDSAVTTGKEKKYSKVKLLPEHIDGKEAENV